MGMPPKTFDFGNFFSLARFDFSESDGCDSCRFVLRWPAQPCPVSCVISRYLW